VTGDRPISYTLAPTTTTICRCIDNTRLKSTTPKARGTYIAVDQYVSGVSANPIITASFATAMLYPVLLCSGHVTSCSRVGAACD